IHGSPLAEVRGNTVLGGFNYGIISAHQDTATLIGNTVENCQIGLQIWYGTNNILKQTTIHRCDLGINLIYGDSLSAEETALIECKTAIQCHHGKGQLTGLQVSGLPKDGTALYFVTAGALTLINCNITAAQVKCETLDGKGDQPLLTSMQYLIVGVKDAPERAVVDVRTSKPALALKPGAQDPNVTNGTAGVSEGRTPLPQTLMPLLVKSWSIGLNGQPVPAPEYTVSVMEPGGIKTLRARTVQPQDTWFRPKPDDPTPTLEVSL